MLDKTQNYMRKCDQVRQNDNPGKWVDGSGICGHLFLVKFK